MFTFLLVAGMLAGFVALYFGAEWLVDGASDIACHLSISKAFIGLTLVAFGTSSPELFTNVIATLHDDPHLPLANVAGSNLANIGAGFGLAALVMPLVIRRQVFLIDLAFVLITPLAVLAAILLGPRTAGGDFQLNYAVLLPLAGLMAVYLYSLRRRLRAVAPEQPEHATMHKPVLLLLLGIGALYVGGELVYRSVVQLASSWGVETTILGLTVVACGTSVPDITTSVIAARRRQFEIAVGNLLGSNIANIFLVLGATLLVAGQGLPATGGLPIDFVAVCAISLLLALVAGIRQTIGPAWGMTLLLLLTGYYAVRMAGVLWW